MSNAPIIQRQLDGLDSSLQDATMPFGTKIKIIERDAAPGWSDGPWAKVIYDNHIAYVQEKYIEETP